jgi:hypothetical protein
MRAIHAALLVAAAAVGTAAFAQSDWEVIGTRDVGFSADRDVIAVRGLDRHHQVRLCAYGGGVHMIDLDTRFANGGHQDVPVRAVIRPRTCTRNIDLIGEHRNMTEIRIVHERLRRRARPRVVVEAR